MGWQHGQIIQAWYDGENLLVKVDSLNSLIQPPIHSVTLVLLVNVEGMWLTPCFGWWLKWYKYVIASNTGWLRGGQLNDISWHQRIQSRLWMSSRIIHTEIGSEIEDCGNSIWGLRLPIRRRLEWGTPQAWLMVYWHCLSVRHTNLPRRNPSVELLRCSQFDYKGSQSQYCWPHYSRRFSGWIYILCSSFLYGRNTGPEALCWGRMLPDNHCVGHPSCCTKHLGIFRHSNACWCWNWHFTNRCSPVGDWNRSSTPATDCHRPV